jgi:hypothetical protein
MLPKSGDVATLATLQAKIEQELLSKQQLLQAYTDLKAQARARVPPSFLFICMPPSPRTLQAYTECVCGKRGGGGGGGLGQSLVS